MIQSQESAVVNGQFIRNGSTAGYANKTETKVLPATAPYVMELDERIHPGSVITPTLNGVAAEVVPWSFTPAPGALAVDRARGKFKYNSGDGGKTLVFTYKPSGTALSASKMEKVLAMVSAAGSEYHTLAAPAVAVAGSVGWIRIPSRGLASRTVKRVSVSAGDMSFLSGTTSFAAAGVAVSLTNTAAASDTHATASGAGSVDTSGGDAWVEVTCSAAGGHGNLSIEIEVE